MLLKKIAVVLLFAATTVFAQTNRIVTTNLFNGDPTGNTCTGNVIQQSSTTGLLYSCQSGVMRQAGAAATGSGTVSGQTPAALPLATGATAIGKSSPLSVDDVNTPTVITNTVAYKGPSVSASVNKVLNVTASPYNAQCDLVFSGSALSINTSGVTSGFTFSASDVGKWLLTYGSNFQFIAKGQIVSVTSGNATITPAPGSPVSAVRFEYGHDDHDSTTNNGVGSGIQQAFTDAGTNNYAIQFPTGSCLTSTIAWKSQSFFGAGMSLSQIVGMPVQDVFAGADTAQTYPYAPYIHDIRITVDSGVNAAATAVSGNNTFPNRIAGTAGGASTPIPAANGGPPAPGGIVFGPTIVGGCSGSMTASSTTFTLSCGKFNIAPSVFLVGQPITVNGAGAAGGTLTTTITSILSATTLQLAAAASTTTSTASGSLGVGNVPPWYVGNCGFAIPNSDGNVSIGGVNGWTFRNVWFDASPGVQNYSCGFFLQAPPNDLHFDHVDYQTLWYSYVEALPATNSGSLFAWTCDTCTFEHINNKFNFVGPVMWNGTHRVITGLSSYGANHPLQTTLWQLGTGFPAATISQIYDECYASSSGEHGRFSGINVVTGAGILACGATQQYYQWVGSTGSFDGQVNGLKITGNSNVFTHTGLVTGGYFQDNGTDNRVETFYSGSGVRYHNNVPREALGKLNGGFIAAGNSATPFASSDDLISTCREFNFAFQNPVGQSGCTSDLHDAGNPAGSYAHLTSALYSSWILGSDGSSQGSGPYGKLWVVGDRLPANPSIKVGILARCSSTCTQSFLVRDVTTTTVLPGSTTMTFGTGWTWQFATVSLASANSVSAGDVMSIHMGAFTGATSQDVAEVAWFPSNQDTVAATLASASLQTNIQGNIGLGGLMMYPCSIGWTSGATPTCATDSTSPYTQQTATLGTSNFARLNSYNGTSLTIGNQFAQNATYILSMSGYAASAYTETITVLCGATSVATPTVTWPTAYASGNPVIVTFALTNAACTSGTAVAINFGQPTQITSLGAITVQQSQATPYPGAGIPNSTGSAWGTSYSTNGTGTVLATTVSPSIATPTITGNAALQQITASTTSVSSFSNTTVATTANVFNMLGPNVTAGAGHGAYFCLGTALSNYNCASIQHVYIGSGSTSNYLNLGLFGFGSGGLNVFSTGVSIASTTAPPTNGLLVAGNVNVATGSVYQINGSQVGSIVSGTSAMGTSAITAGTCATVVTTAATGALTTDTIAWAFNAAPSTGYTAGLHVLTYPTAGNVNFLVCNPTAGSLTPAAATLNWRITR